jgi:hypothetical protein
MSGCMCHKEQKEGSSLVARDAPLNFSYDWTLAAMTNLRNL